MKINKRLSFQRRLESKDCAVMVDSSLRWNDTLSAAFFVKRVLLIMVLILSLSCTGCYWHLRNPSEVPAQLKVLYLDADTVESHFHLQLANLLQSMHINAVKTPLQAPVTLRAYHYRLEHNSPAISTTNVAITYTYTLTVTVEIDDAQGKTIVPPHVIMTSRDITVDTNQIFTINSTSIFQQELQREAIDLIYYWLTSDQTRHYLTTTQAKKMTGAADATQRATTQPAS